MNPSLFPTLLAANKYRIIDYDFPTLLPDSLKIPSGLLTVLLIIAFSIAFGILFAKWAKMRDYGWKIGLITTTVLVSAFTMLFGDYKLGVDLKGGVILVYEVNELETTQLRRGAAENQWSMSQLIAVISKRLNPTGLSEIVVRPFGAKQVEIVVPEVDPVEVEKIKEQIATAGVLQFMIVASDEVADDRELFEAARKQSERVDSERIARGVIDPTSRKEVTNKEGTEREIGYWAKLARDKGDEKTAPFRSRDIVANGFLRDGRTGDILNLTPDQKRLFAGSQSQFDAYLLQHGITTVDVLMVYNQDYSIRGEDLAQAYAGHDESFRPAIHFNMRTAGSHKMGFVTRENLRRMLAIIFDQELLSAPRIQSQITDNGQITGNFSPEEVDFIVGILKSGSMPVVMQKQPTSENQIGSILGRETVQQGSRSILIATGLVFLFMVVYYRFAGFVASFALALNLALTIAIMVALQAPFTLPGLAGLVLTLAMSVDANVLISERMREELAKGATLRMAIRNGFDKALSAIIDGNLTTFLTALVLYSIGTDQVKGFGMTLMLGNITSMFTAIFCARVILDVAERTRFIKTLSMMSFMTKPNIDWVKFFWPAVAGSAILVVIGGVATVARGRTLFDIDLAGGTSVTFLLKDALPEDEVRTKLAGVLSEMRNPKDNSSIDYNVYGMTVETQPHGTVYKVDSSLDDVDLLKAKVREALPLRTFHMDVVSVADFQPEEPKLSAPLMFGGAGAKKSDAKGPSAAEEKAKSTPPAESKPDAATAPKTEEKSGGCGDDNGSSELAQDEQPKKADEQPKKADEQAKKADEQPKADAPAAKSDQEASPATTPPATTPPASTPLPASAFVPPDQATPSTALSTASATPKLQTKVELRFPGNAIGGAALRDRLVASGKAVLRQDLKIVVDNTNWNRVDNSTYENWTAILPLERERAQQVVDHAKAQLDNEVVWQTSSKIGGQVSEHTQLQAVGALGISLLGIIAYVWFRFQRVAWGLAAVAALAHDALVMLTCIALSYWVVGPLGFLGIEEFKISLPVVAAFLTILGYSVNDTIVIFDRLREIRGKNPHITRQMLNDAVNQTLSRNIILAGITLMVVVILYAFGGPGIHAFSFALLTGVLSGCYTTLVIAAPLLLWLLERSGSWSAGKVESRESTRSVA